MTHGELLLELRGSHQRRGDAEAIAAHIVALHEHFGGLGGLGNAERPVGVGLRADVAQQLVVLARPVVPALIVADEAQQRLALRLGQDDVGAHVGHHLLDRGEVPVALAGPGMNHEPLEHPRDRSVAGSVLHGEHRRERGTLRRRRLGDLGELAGRALSLDHAATLRARSAARYGRFTDSTAKWRAYG